MLLFSLLQHFRFRFNSFADPAGGLRRRSLSTSIPAASSRRAKRRHRLPCRLLLLLVPLTLLPPLLFGGCTVDPGRRALADLLYANSYAASFSFLLTDTADGGADTGGADTDYVGEKTLDGAANAVKNAESGAVSLSFSAPETLNGVSVESRPDGKADTLMFGYYGMRAPLPDRVLTKLNLILSFFSDETASAVSALPAGAVEAFPDENGLFPDAVPKCVRFETDGGGTVAVLVYDAATGLPLLYTAECGGMRAQLRFEKFKSPA